MITEESRRTRKKRETKAKILKTARDIFVEKGYENASIEDIANEVDISRATFFNYYPNKESLLVGIANEQKEKFEEYFEEIDRSDMGPLEKIIRVIEWVYFDSIKYLNLNSRVAYSCFPKNGEDVPCTYKAVKSKCSRLVKEAIENKEIESDHSVEDIVRVIVVSCCGLIFDSYYSGKKYGSRKKFKAAMDVLLKGIGCNVEIERSRLDKCLEEKNLTHTDG